MYEIMQKFLSFNRSYKPLKSIGGVVHETANPGDTAAGEANYFNAGYRGASAHAFVDWDSIIQCVPWDEQAWHAGPTANQRYWGIELCHTSDPTKFNEIWKRSVWLFAYLFNTAGITQVTTDNLLSHAQVSEAWHETDHTDPVGYFASFGLTMTDFRNAVQKCIDTGTIDDIVTGGCVMLIKRGDQGQAVAELQEKLNVIGYNLAVDGDFGPATEAAVRSFQSGNGLVSDGIVGPITMEAINAMVEKLQSSDVQQPAPEETVEYWRDKYNTLVAKIKAAIEE